MRSFVTMIVILTIIGLYQRAMASDDAVVYPVNGEIAHCDSGQGAPSCEEHGYKWPLPDQSYFICSIAAVGSHNCRVFIGTDRKNVAVKGWAQGSGWPGPGDNVKCELQSVTAKKVLTTDCQEVGTGSPGCGEAFLQCDNGQQECRNTCTGATFICRGNYVACGQSLDHKTK
jgi:hypothetical protein